MAAEPSQLARQAERISLVEARDARRAERGRQIEERTRLETFAAEQQTRPARKAERDRRYAIRKARQA